jgi:hypothetical protein
VFVGDTESVVVVDGVTVVAGSVVVAVGVTVGVEVVESAAFTGAVCAGAGGANDASALLALSLNKINPKMVGTTRFTSSNITPPATRPWAIATTLRIKATKKSGP